MNSNKGNSENATTNKKYMQATMSASRRVRDDEFVVQQSFSKHSFQGLRSIPHRIEPGFASKYKNQLQTKAHLPSPVRLRSVMLGSDLYNSMMFDSSRNNVNYDNDEDGGDGGDGRDGRENNNNYNSENFNRYFQSQPLQQQQQQQSPQRPNTTGTVLSAKYEKSLFMRNEYGRERRLLSEEKKAKKLMFKGGEFFWSQVSSPKSNRSSLPTNAEDSIPLSQSPKNKFLGASSSSNSSIASAHINNINNSKSDMEEVSRREDGPRVPPPTAFNFPDQLRVWNNRPFTAPSTLGTPYISTTTPSSSVIVGCPHQAASFSTGGKAALRDKSLRMKSATTEGIRKLQERFNDQYPHLNPSVYEGPTGHWICRFIAMKTEAGAAEFVSYMRHVADVDETVTRFKLRKETIHWNVLVNSDQVEFAFRPPWVKVASYENFSSEANAFYEQLQRWGSTGRSSFSPRKLRTAYLNPSPPRTARTLSPPRTTTIPTTKANQQQHPSSYMPANWPSGLFGQ